MVTWTFDAVALFIGMSVGWILGVFSYLYWNTRDGGAWSNGFSDGFDARQFINEVLHEKSKEE